MSKKKNPLFVSEWDRKISPLGSPFVITRHAHSTFRKFCQRDSIFFLVDEGREDHIPSNWCAADGPTFNVGWVAL